MAAVFAIVIGMVAVFSTSALAAGPEEEWTAPEVGETQSGMRDEEARRRLLELETKLRKLEARLAKEVEEKEDRFSYDLTGRFKVRYNLRDNFNLDNPLQEWKFDNRGFVDYRFQLRLDANWKAVQTVLLMDKGNFMFDWKEDSEGTLERWGEFLTVRYPLFRELYAQYTGPVLVQLGRANMALGNDITVEGPIDLMKVGVPLRNSPVGPLTFSASYLAIAGGYNTYDDFRRTGGPPAGDRSQVFQADNRLHGLTASLRSRPHEHTTVELYALRVSDAGGPRDSDLNLDKDFDSSTLPRDGKFEPLWLGAAAESRLFGFDLAAEGVLLRGTYSQGRSLRSHAVYASVRRPVEVRGLHRLAPGLEFALGGGNRAKDSPEADVKDFGALYTCRDRKKFADLFTEDIRAGYFLWDSNLANLTVLRFDAEISPASWVVLEPAFILFRTTEGVYRGRGVVGDWSRGTAASEAQTRDAGWEADLNALFPVHKHLDAFLNLGYFKPGPVFERPSGETADPAREILAGVEVKF